MISALNSGASGRSSSPGQVHFVVFFCKTLYPGVSTGTTNLMLGWTSIPSRACKNTPRLYLICLTWEGGTLRQLGSGGGVPNEKVGDAHHLA